MMFLRKLCSVGGTTVPAPRINWAAAEIGQATIGLARVVEWTAKRI